MPSVNKATILGNLGRDPEVRFTPNGSAVCNISIATTRSWKNKETGEKTEETEWHRIVLYDRLAEIAGEYLRKGRAVYIEGRLKTRKWTDKDGVEKYTTEIVAEQMQLLSAAADAGAAAPGSAGAATRSSATPTRTPAAAPAPAPTQGGSIARTPPARRPAAMDDFSADIPF